MKTVENHCVDCETCTLGYGCPLLNVVCYYCDECNDPAEYTIDGHDYCYSCASDLLENAWDSLSIQEKAESIGMDLSEL